MLIAALVSGPADTHIRAADPSPFSEIPNQFAPRMTLAGSEQEDAVVSLRELMSDSSNDKQARKLFKQALTAENKGDRRAFDLMNGAVTLAPDFFQAHAALAVAYLNAGQLDEAQRHVGISLALNPAYVPAQEILGLILFSKGEYGNAADTLAEVVKEMPCRKTGHYYLSRALYNAGKTKEATDQMDMAEILASKGGCQLVEPFPEPRAAVIVIKDWVQKKVRDHRMRSGKGSIASGLVSSRPSKAATPY